MDMSRFLDDPREGFQERGWVMSGVQLPTSERGRCVKFDYVMQGLNTEALRIIRVDIDTTEMEANEDSQDSQEEDDTGSLRAVLSRTLDDTVGDEASLVKVNNNLHSLYFPLNKLHFRLKLSGRTKTGPTVAGSQGNSATHQIPNTSLYWRPLLSLGASTTTGDMSALIISWWRRGCVTSIVTSMLM